MAVYKVPQDVEADDKLIGPFSFRQFIYLIVTAIAIASAWWLQSIFFPLIIVPLPIILFFAVLALPLKKDQPMETYLSAVVSFYFLKSRKRFWQPDGIDSYVTVIPPKDTEKIRIKDLDEDEASKRLGYLADLVDTRGWSVRGAASTDTSISNDLYYESQKATDIMDTGTEKSQALDQKLQKSTETFRQNAISQMSKPAQKPVTSKKVAPPAQPATPKTPTDAAKAAESAAAYAASLADSAATAKIHTDASTTSTSANTPQAATIDPRIEQAKQLATRDDLSIETISKEVNRVSGQNRGLNNGDEVTISLHDK